MRGRQERERRRKRWRRTDWADMDASLGNRTVQGCWQKPEESRKDPFTIHVCHDGPGNVLVSILTSGLQTLDREN